LRRYCVNLVGLRSLGSSIFMTKPTEFVAGNVAAVCNLWQRKLDVKRFNINK
jgi:hypothetical protein